MVDDIVRNWILDGIESAGSRLPGARAIALLARDGSLTCVPRRGGFVKAGWEERLIANRLGLFSNMREWGPKLGAWMKAELSELRLCLGFKRGMFEIYTTCTLQRNRNQYLDPVPVFNRCFPNRSCSIRIRFRDSASRPGECSVFRSTFRRAVGLILTTSNEMCKDAMWRRNIFDADN